MTNDNTPDHNIDKTNPDRVEGGSTTQGTGRDTMAQDALDTKLDTTLDTSRTGGMGGMAGTVNADTDMAGTAPSGELEDQ